MKIGLVRHFKVRAEEVGGLVEARKFSQWMRAYDEADVDIIDVDLRGIDWNRCYASDLKRAVITAETIYDGEIIKTPLIREISMKFKKEYEDRLDRKIPLDEWAVHSMIHWSRSSEDIVEEGLKTSQKRVRDFLDFLEGEEDEDANILLVCHGMIMTVIDEELRSRGYQGEIVVSARNGELFLFEK